jgi:hypothetical protein
MLDVSRELAGRNSGDTRRSNSRCVGDPSRGYYLARHENLELEAAERRGLAAQNRIEEHFALSSVAGQYEALYRQLALNPHSCGC